MASQSPIVNRVAYELMNDHLQRENCMLAIEVEKLNKIIKEMDTAYKSVRDSWLEQMDLCSNMVLTIRELNDELAAYGSFSTEH